MHSGDAACVSWFLIRLPTPPTLPFNAPLPSSPGRFHQIPEKIEQQGGRGVIVEHAFGREFPELDEGGGGSGGGGLGSYALAIHCGGCMIDQQKIRARLLDLQVGEWCRLHWAGVAEARGQDLLTVKQHARAMCRALSLPL